MYNLQVHLLRAWDSQPLTIPINSRQGARSFEHLNSIFVAMEANPQLIGGLRMELNAFNHYLDAVNHALQNHLFNPASFNIRTSNKTITIAEYLIYARALFRTACRIFSTNGIMLHDVARELTNREKAMFGDLKLLLGYRHAGYRTDSRADNIWWLRPLPRAPIQPPVIPPAAPHQADIINISDSDDDEQPPGEQQPPARPAPPPAHLDNALIILARNNRAPRGNHKFKHVLISEY
jgi:hypothetical protein